ncbi:Dolichyl-phosphate hexose transferase HVO_1613 [uncultured Gammaproteobacteria bacterium]
MSNNNAKITVAMITMNEEQAVAVVVRDIQRVVPGAKILIVDSSTDRTATIAEEMGVQVIRQIPPRGYGPAMDLALRSAGTEVVVTLDCDNTYPTEFILPLAEGILRDDYDLVDASRLEHKPQAMPWINYLANWGFALIASALFLQRITDLHSGMRAYRRSILDCMQYRADGAALPVELLLRPLRQGMKVKSIFIPYRERIGVSTLRPLHSALWTARRILSARFC